MVDDVSTTGGGTGVEVAVDDDVVSIPDMFDLKDDIAATEHRATSARDTSELSEADRATSAPPTSAPPHEV